MPLPRRSAWGLAAAMLVAVVPRAAAQQPSTPLAANFYVDGRHLHDPCGDRVVLRGVNKMVYWVDIDGFPSCREIARTGANVVRIQWLTPGTADELDIAITNCAAARLIPMVELHDGIGDWTMLQTLVDYWTRPDVVAVLERHRDHLLINIGNEVGDRSVTPDEFRTGYESAVLQIRDAGIHVPLIIDGTNWGKDIDVLQSQGPALIEADPDHNLMFSIHMWWPLMWGYTAQTVIDELAESVRLELPLIVGEFGNQWTETPAGAIPYRTILEHTHVLGIGMLPWEWGPGNHPQTWLDMTTDGTFDTLHGWGLEVAVTHPYSIRNTAKRSEWMVYRSCEGRPRRAPRRPGERRHPPGAAADAPPGADRGSAASD